MCTHETSIVIIDVEKISVTKCTWECGEYLIEIRDGIMTHTFTPAEILDIERLQRIETIASDVTAWLRRNNLGDTAHCSALEDALATHAN